MHFVLEMNILRGVAKILITSKRHCDVYGERGESHDVQMTDKRVLFCRSNVKSQMASNKYDVTRLIVHKLLKIPFS